MAHVLRLIVAALLLAAGHAHALIPKISYYEVTGGYSALSVPSYTVTGTNWITACDAWLAAWPNPVYVVAKKGAYQTYCNFTVTRVSTGEVTLDNAAATTTLRSNVCPANSTAVTGGCQCNSGYEESGSMCVPALSDLERYCRDLAGSWNERLRVRRSGITASGQVCDVPHYEVPGIPSGHGCVADTGDGIGWTDDDGVEWYSGRAKATSGTCTGPLAGDPSKPENSGQRDPCPNGYPGTVNGTQVCAQHDPSGGIDWTGQRCETKPDGSSTCVSRQTSCKGGQCTTNTTTTDKDPQGNVTGTTQGTATEGIRDLCAKDPGNRVCSATGITAGGGGGGNGGDSFGGSCAAGFQAVSEDPVVNAMALEQHKRNCLLFETDSDERQAYLADKAAGQARKASGNEDVTGELPGGGTVDLGPGSNNLQGTSIINANSCFTDRTISIMGSEFVLKLSLVCPFMEWLGLILVSIAYLVGARIVVRG